MSDTGPALFASAQGQGSVSAANLNTLTQSCNTFADLRAFIGVSGIMVYARGGVSIADGLQGFFYWNASGTGPDNNSTTIVPASAGATGVWTRSPIIAALVNITSDTAALFPDTDNAVTLGTSTLRWSEVFSYLVRLTDVGSGDAVTLQAPALSASYTFQFPASQGTLGQILVSGGSNQPPVWQTGGSAIFQQGQIGGLIVARGSFTSISLSVGYCVSDDISTFMRLPTGIAKTSASWTAGNNNGGLDTGIWAASTTYNVFVIKNPTNGATDALLSLNAFTPTLPAGYTKQRRVGAVVTDGSANIVPFTQIGNLFRLTTPVLFTNTIGTAGSLVTLAPGMPLSGGVSGVAPLQAILRGSISNAAAGISVSVLDPAVSGLAAGVPPVGITQVGAQLAALGEFAVEVNLFSQVSVGASANSTTLNLYLMGWTDTRGFDG